VATLGGDGDAVGINAELGPEFGCGGGTQVSVQTFAVDQDPTTKDISLGDLDNGFYIAIN
jgi:hypothetical protein